MFFFLKEVFVNILKRIFLEKYLIAVFLKNNLKVLKYLENAFYCFLISFSFILSSSSLFHIIGDSIDPYSIPFSTLTYSSYVVICGLY